MRRCKRTEKRINFVGYTPFVFGNQRQFAALVRELAQLGYAVCWLGGGKLAELREAPKASVNWVISEVGLELAKWMEKQYGTPWFYQMPVSVSGVRAAYQYLESITGDAAFRRCPQDTVPFKREQRNAVMIGDHELNRQMSTALKNEFYVECAIVESFLPSGVLPEKWIMLSRIRFIFSIFLKTQRLRFPCPSQPSVETVI